MSPKQDVIRFGIDTGGTFTDLLCLDKHGLRVHKLPSVPADPSRAILEGIRTLLGESPTDQHLEVTHGSTVATNAILERKGARIALVTTKGFEDVLRIGRQTRPELYNFMVRQPEPLVDPNLTFGLQERIAADGTILRPLDRHDIDALIATLQEHKVESVAICFLHSYRNPHHEQMAATTMRAAGLLVSASHEILPEYREVERWSTTTVNAYVAPLMAAYLDRLQHALGTARLRIMQSNGGSISAARAGREAVQTILSGPAAGVVGAQAIAAASGFTRLLTLDIGGTSADVSLLDRAIGTTNESLVGGLPVRLPMLDIHTVGAGGGSIAWIDSGGALRVGPGSAGADPGPACFGTGHELTVTDAHLLLGRLDPAFFLGGRTTLDLARTQRIATTLARALGLTVRTLAEGILRIANANMERALRVVSVQRGFDPRDFALLAFGGAGGLHACDLAASLDIPTVLIPEHSGVLSAYGMLLADVAKDYSASLLSTRELTPDDLDKKLQPLIAQANQDLDAEGFPARSRNLTATVAMRYRGQSFEIDVPIADMIDTDALIADFHQRHAKLYGYSNPQRSTEPVQLRLRAIGVTTKPTLPTAQAVEPRPLPHADSIRPVIFARRAIPTPIFHRRNLAPGMTAQGPAIIASGESTNVISPGWSWQIDHAGTLLARSIAHRGPHAN